jgi:5-formyltetrahydrofolate cyclo-ligase
MGDQNSQKSYFRKLAFLARKRSNTEDSNERINKKLDLLIDRGKASLIAAYLAIGSEVSPILFMKKRALEQVISVPVVEDSGEPLKFSIWMPSSELKIGEFGVAIPQITEFVEPDIIIVPMLAFDSRGARLGYGGGFYDRTLKTLRAKKKITAVGIAFSGQEFNELPIDENDQFLDCIVTESDTFWY